MSEFWGMLNMQLLLFILMGVGYLTAKLRIVDDAARGVLSNLVLYIFLPCGILRSFMITFDAGMAKALWTVLGAAVALQVFCILINMVIYRFVPEKKRTVLKYGTLCSNNTFIGVPVVEGVYGALAVTYASVFVIPHRLTVWSAGVAYFTKGTSALATAKKLVTNPCVIATALGLVFMATGLRLPQLADRALLSLSNCTTAVSMMVVGHILARVKLRSVFSKLALYYCFVRLVALPLLMMVVLMALKTDPMVIGVCVALTGMPAGTSTAMFADKFGGDAEFASKIIFVSVLLSMVTIPLLTGLVGLVV